MLRITQTGRLEIEKKRRITPDFLKSFMLALLFHFGIFYIFRITFLTPPDESHLLPFSEVVAVWDEKISIVQVAHYKNETGFDEMNPELFLEHPTTFRTMLKNPPPFEKICVEREIPYSFNPKCEP